MVSSKPALSLSKYKKQTWCRFTMWGVLNSWPSQETSVAAEIDEDEESMVPLLEKSS